MAEAHNLLVKFWTWTNPMLHPITKEKLFLWSSGINNSLLIWENDTYPESRRWQSYVSMKHSQCGLCRLARPGEQGIQGTYESREKYFIILTRGTFDLAANDPIEGWLAVLNLTAPDGLPTI